MSAFYGLPTGTILANANATLPSAGPFGQLFFLAGEISVAQRTPQLSLPQW